MRISDTQDEKENLAQSTDETQTPSARLISRAINELGAANGVDTALLDILVTNIVRLDPQNTAVEDALDQIEQLADRRVRELGL